MRLHQIFLDLKRLDKAGMASVSRASFSAADRAAGVLGRHGDLSVRTPGNRRAARRVVLCFARLHAVAPTPPA